MNELRINLHSISDVITNSSEVIYIATSNKGVSYLKELMNKLLKMGGSDKTADDLFEFKIEPDEYFFERAWDRLCDNGEIDKEIVKRHDDYQSDKKWKEANEFMKMTIRDMLDKGKIKEEDFEDDYGYPRNNLILIPKGINQQVIDMTKEMQAIFNIEATRDG
jgi:hypothetical protein